MKDKSPVVSAEIERAVRGEVTAEQAAEAVMDIIEAYVHEQDRLAELARNADRLAAIGEMVAGVAHELNNPLTGISTFSQLLLEEELTEEQMESVGLIKREADRAVGIIRDLLIFSRKTGPREVDVDLNSILQHSIRLRSHSAKAKRDRSAHAPGSNLACNPRGRSETTAGSFTPPGKCGIRHEELRRQTYDDNEPV